MTTRAWLKGLAAVAVMLGLVGVASADSVYFTGNYGFYSGTGNGPVLGVLALGNGSDALEWGGTGWNGSAATFSSSVSQVKEGTGVADYFAQSVGTLKSYGFDATNLALAFQVNISGQSAANYLHVDHFFVDFYNANGTVAASLEYTPDGHSTAGTSIDTDFGRTTDDGILPGVGQGTSGWLYTFKFEDSTFLSTFFGDDANRIGMHVLGLDTTVGNKTTTTSADISNATDGPDNFFFTKVDQVTPVPLPAAVWSGMLLMGGIGAYRARRRSV